ncbi:hypothetical protein ABIE53_005100 [Burkholderia sp. OAS925]
MPGRVRVHLAFEQHERLVAVQAAAQFRERQIEQFRKRRQRGFVEQLGRCPDLVSRETDGEHRAIAVDNAPTRRVEFDRALIALLPLIDIEVAVHHLHPERAARERGKRGEHQHDDELRAPHRQTRNQQLVLRDGRIRIARRGFFLRDHGGPTDSGLTCGSAHCNENVICVRDYRKPTRATDVKKAARTSKSARLISFD